MGLFRDLVNILFHSDDITSKEDCYWATETILEAEPNLPFKKLVGKICDICPKANERRVLTYVTLMKRDQDLVVHPDGTFHLVKGCY